MDELERNERASMNVAPNKVTAAYGYYLGGEKCSGFPMIRGTM